MPRTFKLLRTLGEGAFGAVHLAEVHGAEGFVQTLAVKWLRPQWSDDAELVGRLRDEARLLALLSHDHIVRVHGLTRIAGRLAILMEVVDGADLSQVGREPVPARAVAEILEAAADALDAAWRTVPPGGDAPLKVVHRDIKPSNIMVTPRGAVKVMDFGVARATFESREAKTRSQQFGTARYMAPERWLDGVAEAPSDVFSLGVTALELLGGTSVEQPRLSREGFEEDITAALRHAAPWPELAEVLRQMVAYRPEDRPTARDVAERCRALAEQLPAPGLRGWAGRWVDAHRSACASAEDGAEIAEDVSGDTFAFVPAAGVAATEPFGATTTAPHASGPVATSASGASTIGDGEAPPRVLAEAAGYRGMWYGFFGSTLAVATVFALWVVVVGPPRWQRATPAEAEAPSTGVEREVPAPTEREAPPPEVALEAPPTPQEPPPDRPPEEFRPVPGVRIPRPPAREAVAEPAVEAPPVEVVPEAPQPARVTGLLTFVPDPPDLRIETAAGVAKPHQAIALPQGPTSIVITSGDTRWSCTVNVEAGERRYAIDGRAKRCQPTN